MRYTIDARVIQQGLATLHHETGGRVQHPGTPDGIYARFSERSLISWLNNTPEGRNVPDRGIVSVTDPDGRTRHINVDNHIGDPLIGASTSYRTTYRRPIQAPTTTSQPDPTPAPATALPFLEPREPTGNAPPPSLDDWYGDGSMELDPEPGTTAPPIPRTPGVAPAPVPQPQPGAQLPTFRLQRRPDPVWPWVVGIGAVVAIGGFVYWQSTR